MMGPEYGHSQEAANAAEPQPPRATLIGAIKALEYVRNFSNAPFLS
jgi:hypothetical protein